MRPGKALAKPGVLPGVSEALSKVRYLLRNKLEDREMGGRG